MRPEPPRPSVLRSALLHMRADPGTPRALLGVVFCVLAFSALSLAVSTGATADLDASILIALRSATDLSDPIGPGWLEEQMRDVTALGGMSVTALLTLGVAVLFAVSGRRRLAVFVFCAVASGFALSLALKWGFDRPRPDLVPHGSVVLTRSFPSGHSMTAATVYLTLGALVSRVQPQRGLRAFFLVLAGLLTVLVGASRVYLGVHWPSDVLAGWIAGSGWALACWTAAAYGLRTYGFGRSVTQDAAVHASAAREVP